MAFVHYPMAQHDARLWGRGRGADVRREIEKTLAELNDGNVLGLDLNGVEVMDFSFASEVIGKLIWRMPVEYPDRSLVLMNASSYVKENLDAALKGMELAALIVGGADEWEVVGKLGQTDIETLKELARGKRATAGEMAKSLGISVTACNNRLRKLTDLGLIRRVRVAIPSGAELYCYEWLV